MPAGVFRARNLRNSDGVKPNVFIPATRGETPISKRHAPEKSHSSFGLKADGMPRVKTARRPISGLPARGPFAGVTIVRRCIESQPGNNCKRVTLPRVDGDPFARAALAVAPKLG